MDDITNICPLQLAMDIVSGKWRLSIICLLEGRKPMRYNHIRRCIPGITNVMLSQSLKQLEEYGIVHREQYNEVPVRVEYQLTESGRNLLSILDKLSVWGNQLIEGHPEYSSKCPNCIFRETEDERNGTIPGTEHSV